jgi:hypothetical protein
MKKKIKPLHAVLGCGGLLVAGIVASLLAVQALSSVFGKIYWDTPSDRAKLRSIREPFLPIPPALEAHRKIHGDYPNRIANLDPSVPRIAEVEAAFRSNTSLVYQTDGPSEYTLYLKLNWDGGLAYSSTWPKWVFGMNGDTEWPID